VPTRHRLSLALALGLFVGGALVVVVLGLSMLAARDTEHRALASLQPWARMGEVMTAHGRQATGCAPSSSPGQEVLVSESDGEREARCLHTRGLLSLADLRSITSELRRTSGQSVVARWFPVNLQLIPTRTTVTVWALVLAAELGGLALFARRLRARST
jgi:hypothetical protein